MIKGIYSVFIGVLLATFVGVGIAAFYPEPKYPEFPHAATVPLREKPTDEEYAKIDAEQREYERVSKQFQDSRKVYNRNVSIVSLTFAVLILVVSLTLFKKLQVIADGLLLGGVLTLLYSIVRGFETDDNMFRFMVVTAGLLTSLVLGYLKFIQPQEAKAKR